MAGNAIAAKMAASKSGGISPALRAKTATFSQPNRPAAVKPRGFRCLIRLMLGWRCRCCLVRRICLRVLRLRFGIVPSGCSGTADDAAVYAGRH